MDYDTEHKLRDPKRIQWLLSSLMNQHQLITLSLPNTELKERTMVVDVCAKSSSVLLDAAMDSRIHEKIVSGQTFSLATSHDGVDVRVESINAVKMVTDKKGDLYKIELPKQIYYIQRRGNFRVSLIGLFSIPVNFEADQADDIGALTSVECSLSNISAKGCLVSISDKTGEALNMDDFSVILKFDLPESDESVSVSACMRHSRYLKRSEIWLAGFEFQDVPSAVSTSLDKLIMKLQMAARNKSRIN